MSGFDCDVPSLCPADSVSHAAGHRAWWRAGNAHSCTELLGPLPT